MKRGSRAFKGPSRGLAAFRRSQTSPVTVTAASRSADGKSIVPNPEGYNGLSGRSGAMPSDLAVRLHAGGMAEKPVLWKLSAVHLNPLTAVLVFRDREGLRIFAGFAKGIAVLHAVIISRIRPLM